MQWLMLYEVFLLLHFNKLYSPFCLFSNNFIFLLFYHQLLGLFFFPQDGGVRRLILLNAV